MDRLNRLPWRTERLASVRCSDLKFGKPALTDSFNDRIPAQDSHLDPFSDIKAA